MSFHNILKVLNNLFKFLVTVSNIAPNMTLGGRVKACKIIGCNSEYFRGYSHSNVLFYILRFCPCDLDLFIDLNNWAIHLNNLTRSEDEVRGDFRKSAHLTWNDPLCVVAPD